MSDLATAAVLATPSVSDDTDHDVLTVQGLDPTHDTYGDLTHAFRFFNERLFLGRLSPTLITLRATGRTYGYFSPERFVNPRGGQPVHEIAFNPETFAQRGVEDVLSTLVHEMVHQQQHEENTVTRRGYHNRDFELKMRAVGLVPSATGQPGGPSVGQKMTHYIDADGPFLQAATELLDRDFRIRWAERFLTRAMPRVVIAPAIPGAQAPRADRNAPPAQGSAPASAPNLTAAPSASAIAGVVGPAHKPVTAAARSKSKHVCPKCRAAAWGKPSLKLICGACAVPFALEVR